MFETLRQRIEALPEPEYLARRAMYSDQEWERSWALQAYPHQLPPLGDDWRAWTVIGGPGTGKTVAGMRWVEAKLENNHPCRILIVTPSGHMNNLETRVRDDLHHRRGTEWELLFTSGEIRVQWGTRIVRFVSEENAHRDLQGGFFDYIWGDEIFDAQEIINRAPRTQQFCFTEPTKLPTETMLSRAGGPRVL